MLNHAVSFSDKPLRSVIQKLVVCHCGRRVIFSKDNTLATLKGKFLCILSNQSEGVKFACESLTCLIPLIQLHPPVIAYRSQDGWSSGQA